MGNFSIAAFRARSEIFEMDSDMVIPIVTILFMSETLINNLSFTVVLSDASAWIYFIKLTKSMKKFVLDNSIMNTSRAKW